MLPEALSALSFASGGDPHPPRQMSYSQESPNTVATNITDPNLPECHSPGHPKRVIALNPVAIAVCVKSVSQPLP